MRFSKITMAIIIIAIILCLVIDIMAITGCLWR